MPWAPSSTLPGVPPRTSRGLRSDLDLSSGGWSPIRAGALYLAVEADYSFPDGSRAEGSRSDTVVRRSQGSAAPSSSKDLPIDVHDLAERIVEVGSSSSLWVHV